MGCVYLCTIMTCALLIKKAPEGFTVKTAPFNNKQSLLKSLSHSLGLKVAAFLPKFEHLGNGTDIPIKKVMATKQFYLLWGVFISLATVGMSIAGTAKDMIFEVFGKTLPSIVTPSFAVGFVAAFSVFNLIGRIFWASFSDRFGKKNTFRIFSFAGLPLALLLPLSITAMLFFLGDSFEDRFGEKISKNSAILMLAVFTTCSLLVGSIFGGTYATVPAFATELFGRGMIEKVHGRLLTASALAGIIGPVLVSQLRSHSEKRAITQLATLVDEETFKTEFKVGRDEIPKLIAAKTLTIQRILKLTPEGTPDPTPKLYSGTLYIISSLFVVAAVLNRGITKVPKNINIKNGDMNK